MSRWPPCCYGAIIDDCTCPPHPPEETPTSAHSTQQGRDACHGGSGKGDALTGEQDRPEGHAELRPAKEVR